jgi:hypothetical protein
MEAERTDVFIVHSRNNQQYALISTTTLFYTLAPTCFGISLPSSGSFLDPSELLEIKIDLVVNHIMLVKWPVCRSVGVSECRGSVCCASQLSAFFIFKNSKGQFSYGLEQGSTNIFKKI